MTKLREKAQGQVKQMVGQMIGDHRLEQEGREQLEKADQIHTAREAKADVATENEVDKYPVRPQSKGTR